MTDERHAPDDHQDHEAEGEEEEARPQRMAHPEEEGGADGGGTTEHRDEHGSPARETRESAEEDDRSDDADDASRQTHPHPADKLEDRPQRAVPVDDPRVLADRTHKLWQHE